MSSRSVLNNVNANKQKNVEAAAKSKNPLDSIEYTNFKAKTGDEYTFYSCAKSEIESKTLKWAFKLAEKNVSSFYKELKMGWQPKIKQNDLNKSWARYLVALNKKKEPVAYAMFRFDMDYGYSVLYCYEMQIEPDYQRQGIGRFMMKALESCARYWKMEKIVLTVLNNNENGISFFKSIGYITDDSSPSILDAEDYTILSISLL